MAARTWIVALAIVTGCTTPAGSVDGASVAATADSGAFAASASHTGAPTEAASARATRRPANRDAGRSDECAGAFYWEHPDCPLPPLVATDDIVPAGVGVDEIAPIDEPRFESLATAAEWLAADSPVMVVRVGDDVRAYPLAILVWHEVVNDVVGGAPVVVTYCPLCGTGIVFERTVDGEVLDFGTSGHLWRSNLVLYDRQHRNFWSQVYGRGIAGHRFQGRELARVPAMQVGFARLARAHPGARVLARPAGAHPYGTTPYEDYEQTGPYFPSGPGDARLDPMTRVIGLGAPDERPVAITLDHLRAERVVMLRRPVGRVVVLWEPGRASALDDPTIDDGREVGQTGAYRAQAPDGRELTFRTEPGGRVVDRQTGSVWDVFGRAERGPLRGTRLAPVLHDDTFWFAWHTFRSGTDLVGG